MPLNSSGPISLAGSTAGQSIALELGLIATGQISLNDTNVRTLANVPSGAITMPTNFYGKSNRVQIALTLSANTANYTLNTAKVSGLGYVAGSTDVTLTINSGVFVSSASTGSYAFTVDTSWNAGDSVTIVNNGTIVGRGGNGGDSACCGVNNGFSGGPALQVSRATSINNGSGRIAGGGGGGGTGFGNFINCIFCKGQPPCSCGTICLGGAGGGGGIGGSTGGAGSNCTGGSSNPGGNGTLTAAGGGGTTPGYSNSAGAGGGYGSAGGNGANSGGTGGSGGAAGAAVVGNSNITWIATGTRNGSIS